LKSGSASFTALMRGLAASASCLIALAVPAGLAAQGIVFTGYSASIGSNWSSPQAVAVDAAGDVFVAEPGSVFELLAAGGAPQAIGSGWNSPTSIAVDGSGNLYVVDSHAGFQVALELKWNGASFSNPITLGGGASAIGGIVSPVAVASDQRGDRFIVDAGGGQSKPSEAPQIVITNSIAGTVSYPLSEYPAPVPGTVAVDPDFNLYYGDSVGDIVSWPYTAGTGLYNSPGATLWTAPAALTGLAAEATGDVFLTWSGGGGVFELPAQSTSPIGISSGWNNPQGLALDESGNLYAADTGLSQIEKVQFNAVNFGDVGICPAGLLCSAPSIKTLNLSFSIASGVSVGSIGVFMQGAAGLDFLQNPTNTTCPVADYDSITSCLEEVEFAPIGFSGLRQGALVFFSGPGYSGTMLDSLPVYGTATAPQLAFTSALPAVQAGTVKNPISVALSGSGEIYTIDATGVLWKQQGVGGAPIGVGSFGSSSASKASGVVVDGAGDLFVSDQVAKTVTEFPAGKTQPVVVLSNTQGGLIDPRNLAVDGSGNLYVPDAVAGKVYEVQPRVAQPTVIASGLKSPESVAVDGSGNVFIAAANLGGTGEVVKVASGGGAPQTVTGPWTTPWEVAVDAAGDLFVTDAACTCAWEAPAGGGTIVKVLTSLYTFPSIAIDGGGDLFYSAANLMELQRSQPPALTFASAAVGSTSSDSPKTVTVQNIGNQQADFQSVTWPTDFSEASGDSAACIAGNLAPGLTCDVPIDFTPKTAGSLTESVTLNYSGSDFDGASQFISVSGAATQLKPVVTWTPPAPVTFGTPLSATQLDAQANVTGTFVYTPALGSLLAVGTEALSVTFTPTNPEYATITTTVSLTVNIATPVITWPQPAAIVYGTPLGTNQLDATANTVGTFTYNPAAGTVLATGGHLLSVTFTPDDPVDYTTGAATTVILVNPATPAITWATPAAIVYGTPLSSTQLDATSNVPGTFTYSPTAGTVLAVGSQTLTAFFSPTDSTDYLPAQKSVILAVNSASAIITWPTPAPIAYGTPLSSTQLDATATLSGAFVYSPPSGTVLSVGVHTLSVTFTPSKPGFANATATVTITVNKATPVITWPTPAPIPYLTPLSATQLDATASTPGKIVYTPSAGTVLSGGVQTLAANFTPTDTVDYVPVRVTVALTVERIAPTLGWANPQPIVYGTALSTTQLSAVAGVPGSFVYSPPAGTVLDAGTQVLSLTFTPNNLTDYSPITVTRSLTVKQATPVITWPEPASITYGTALSLTQLDATASVKGTFAYTPASGTVLKAGTYSLSATFTPTDAVDYASPTATVTLTVNKALPTITWATPAPITYPAPLSATQLDATASVPGVLTYTPSAGTVVNAGSQELKVLLVPTDGTDYEVVGASVQITVNKATPPINWSTPIPITYGSPLGGSQLKATSPVPGTFVYTPPLGTILNAGTQTLSVVFTPTNTTDYTTATDSAILTVNKAAPALKLTASATSVTQGASVTFTATLTGNSASSPTGNIQILDGTTVLISAQPNSGGVVTLTTSTLAVGKHTVTASYAGNTNYTAATSIAVSVTVNP
jgi:hypothetical protein